MAIIRHSLMFSGIITQILNAFLCYQKVNIITITLSLILRLFLSKFITIY